MLYTESDIDFRQLSGSKFEELCFDLLLRLNFHALIWRQGGGDSGRDIEALSTVINQFVGTYTERWFIECKNHTSAISIEDLNTKILWARSDKPDHFVLVTSSHLTNPTRRWISSVADDTSFRIHVVEGKVLKRLLLGYPDLIAKYFADEITRLVRESMRAWISYGIIPSVETLALFKEKLKPSHLSVEELAFVHISGHAQSDAIEIWAEEHFSFDFDDYLDHIAHNSNHLQPILQSLDLAMVTSISISGADHSLLAEIEVRDEVEPMHGLFLFVVDESDRLFEMIILRSSTFPVRIHCAPDGGRQYAEIVLTLLSTI